MPSSEPANSVTISGKNRNLGLYIAGLPGGGKTSLLQNLALRDIQRGHGVCVIDPTRVLIRGLAHHIPKWREKDVILFTSEHPVPIDFFSYGKTNKRERIVLRDLLISTFDFHRSAPRAEPYLMEILGTLFDANENGIPDADRCTFLDIHDFIHNEDRREEIIRFTPNRQKYWQSRPDSYWKECAPIVTRLKRFDEDDVLKAMFAVKQPKVNIPDVIAHNRILLVDLQETDSDRDVAALIAAKFRQAIFARSDITNEDDIEPYYLYIDECHHVLKFADEDFETVLTGARKFKLCLTLANQFPSKLPAGIKTELAALQATILFQLQPPSELAPFQHRFPKPYDPGYLKIDFSTIAEAEVRKRRLEADLDKERAKYNPRRYKRYGIAPPDEQGYAEKIAQATADIASAQKSIDDRQAFHDSLARPDLVQLIDQLPTGEALYIPNRGQPFVIKTPTPLVKHNEDTCYKHLLNLTKENWTPDEPPPMSYTKNNARSDPTSTEKDGAKEKVKPVPPHRKKGRGTGALK